MKYNKIAKLGFVIAIAVFLTTPTHVAFASSVDIDIQGDTKNKSTIKEFIDNHKTTITDSGLINREQSSVKNNNTGDGNASSTANSNNGDGVNSNVSTTDIVDTNVNINFSNNSINHSESNSRNKDQSSFHNDESSRITTYNDGSDQSNEGNSSDSFASDASTEAPRTNEEAQTSTDKKNAISEKIADHYDSNTLINDEPTPLGSYLLSQGYELVSKTNPGCGTEGSVIYYNPETKDTQTETLEALEHKIKLENVKGSFLSSGKVISYCENCGQILSEEEDAPVEKKALPFAGVLGTIGAALIAFIKKH